MLFYHADNTSLLYKPIPAKKYFPLHDILSKCYGPKFSREVWAAPISPIAQYRYNSIAVKEPSTLLWIRTFDDNTVFLDIGSNIGIYSIAAHIVGASSIYSIDPLPHNIFELNRIINDNQINNIFPICAKLGNNNRLAAVSPDTKALSKFDFNPLSLGEFSGAGVILHKSLIRDCFLSPSLDTNNIEQLSLLGITDIKIDVDGAELEVLRCLSPLFSNPAFRSIAIEVRQSTHLPVSTFLSKYSIKELLSFRDVSGFEPRRLQGLDTMTFFGRS